MNQIAEIIGALTSPLGVSEAELEKLDPDYKAQLEFLEGTGMNVFKQELDGNVFYSNVKLDDTPTQPAPATAAAPPAEAPRSTQPDQEPEDPPDTPEPDFDARLIVDSFEVKTREGRMPIIKMTPAGPKSSTVASLFPSKKPKGALVMVYLKIIEPEKPKETSPEREESPAATPEPQQHPPHTTAPAGPAVPEMDTEAPVDTPEEGGDEAVVAPEDYGSIQINSKGKANEKAPKAKPKEQLEREINEQVKRGEISPAAADATARLAGL